MGHSGRASCIRMKVLPTKRAAVPVQTGSSIGAGTIVFVVQYAVVQFGALGQWGAWETGGRLWGLRARLWGESWCCILLGRRGNHEGKIGTFIRVASSLDLTQWAWSKAQC